VGLSFRETYQKTPIKRKLPGRQLLIFYILTKKFRNYCTTVLQLAYICITVIHLNRNIMTTAKQRSIQVHKQLVRDGKFDSARRLLRAINNRSTQIGIGYDNIDWTLGHYLCGNEYKYVTIQ
jgi:hypothetical protein